jgi:FkbM family methyltransferase
MSYALKRLIRGILRRFNVDVVRYRPKRLKSTRTRALSYFETATGNYYLPRDAHGDLIANQIKAGRVFDEEIIRVARRYAKPGTAVLDVGANFGQMSILLSNIVGDQGKVYSFDADDFVFELLTKNIAANGREQRIVPVFGAVHNVPNQTLYSPLQDFVRFQTYGSYGIDYGGNTGRPVPSITIDSLDIAEPISFMKVDVQGGDLQAMQGAVGTIAKNKMPIVFEYEYQFEAQYKLSFQDYVDFVGQIGYRFESVINGYNYLIVPR